MEDNVDTEFSLDVDYAVGTDDAVVVKTPLGNVLLTNDCTTGDGKCIHFPTVGWTFFQPSGNIATGDPRTFTMSFDNAIYVDRTDDVSTNRWYVETLAGNGGGSNKIREEFESTEPPFAPIAPTVDVIPTQADYWRPYIVRVFNNIIQLNVTGIWRTSYSKRLEFNIPGNYEPIDDYCLVGNEIFDITHADYVRFPCSITGARQITAVIPDSYLADFDDTKVIFAFFRGFLPLTTTTGNAGNAAVRCYQHLTRAHVVDEVNYNFDIDPIPTPILRDVNLNLAGLFQREAEIGNYVMFYGAIWPNTLQTDHQITQFKFQVTDDYTYPALQTMSCNIKRIFKEDVDCILQRKLGKTEIIVDAIPPAQVTPYDHGPFLIRITQTQEDLLFLAPEREGSFLFNVTFLDANGDMVEQADSYMSISGGFVSGDVFTLNPILLDPLTETLWDLQFTTTERTTPQGYFESGIEVFTQIYLEFQRFDPAFPLDLGSGLSDGSEVSCVPVQGMTISKIGKLTCTMYYGDDIDPTTIIIEGYDPIEANTLVQIYIDHIATLQVASTSSIGFSIRSNYSGESELYTYYGANNYQPVNDPTAYTGNGATGFDAIVRSGSLILREKSNWQFDITLTSALTANQDWIVIEFPDFVYERDSDYSGVTVAITGIASESYIMNLKNTIYIYPTAAVGAGARTITITDLPNPTYSLNSNLDFSAFTVVNDKTVDVFEQTETVATTACDFFSDIEITYPKKYIRMNENEFTFTFTINHIVPEEGSVAIIFDDTAFNLRPSSPTCELLTGFPESATCDTELFQEQMVRIKLNGEGISSGTEVSIKIDNVNNPTDNSITPSMKVASYFLNTELTTTLICEKSETIPQFLQNPIKSCEINVATEFTNANEPSDYLITFACSQKILNNTELSITLPNGVTFDDANLECSTNGNYLLEQCSRTARTNIIKMPILKPSVQDDLVVRISGVTNPSTPGTYGPITATLSQYDVLYAQSSSSSQLTYKIASDENKVSFTDNIHVSIYPKNYGQTATYYFKLVGLNFKVKPTKFYLTFDTDFARDLGSSLACGTFTPNQDFGSAYALNFEDLEDLTYFSCEKYTDYSLVLTPNTEFETGKITEYFFFIEGIVNPNEGDDLVYDFDF